MSAKRLMVSAFGGMVICLLTLMGAEHGYATWAAVLTGLAIAVTAVTVSLIQS